ncbi:DNA-binding protein BIN4-like isoform X1 [Phoenix dactylifera]|uniref:DNA-binding protein BIN4-like isoform X1 n=1 Tax=Phoenix dactylifera TaxID=42345 RepID=A0A8B7CL13_PHODC|nr:DNA-binding protein BIN4-like isoform X1 [Phoenix dactylifera]
MSDSREESPDWLRAFQAPSQGFVILSSASDSSPESSPARSDHIHREVPEKRQKEQHTILIYSGEESPAIKGKKQKTVKTKTNQKLKEDTLDVQDEGPSEEDIREKPAGPTISSRLPLVFPDKVQRSKVLVECDGDSIDLSGDVGAVGRIVISNASAGNQEMLLDLKGTLYKSTIVPSRTFCIVGVGQSEAKIEAIMNDFIQLEPQSNVFEAETMIEGTLDGFSFDSEEEADRLPKSSAHQSDRSNENGVQLDMKTKGKVEKSSGSVRKAKGTARSSKKAARKPQVAKKTKKKK